MEIEEGEFYTDFQICDDFSIAEAPKADELALPALPEVYRVKDVEIMLPDDPKEKIRMICRRHGVNGGWETISREYDMFSDG
jgi:hypothetical protein